VKRIHIAVVAALLGLAAILGTFAATRTVHLGAASTRAQDAAIATRARQLNAFEASLRRQLAVHRTKSAPAPQVVYHRPPPVVVVRHTGHGEHEGEEHEGGGDD
jgi:hypothetical protein